MARFGSLQGPGSGASPARNLAADDRGTSSGGADVGSWWFGRFCGLLVIVSFRRAVCTPNALHRGLAIELHIERITPVALRRQSGEPRRQMLVRLRWGVQLHAERRQALACAYVAEPCVALVMAQLEQVLRIELTAQLFGKIGGVLRAG